MAAAPTYTITSASFEAEAGDNISAGANQTVTLVISPSAGNTILSSNFSIGEALPSEVASAVFSQDGDNVNCLITFDASFVMPSNDVELLIDIDGTANEQTFTVAGAYSTTEGNTTGISGAEILFSQTAAPGTEVTLLTKTFTAASGYYFASEPYFYQGNAKNESDYIITWQDNGLGELFTSRSYTIKYIVGNQSETLTSLYFVAIADLQSSQPGTPVLKSYVVNTKAWLPEGGTKTLTFYGDPGADFTLTYTIDGIGPGATSYTMPDSGSLSIIISAGENSSGSTKTYSYLLGGDILSPFPQNNPFTITQPSS